MTPRISPWAITLVMSPCLAIYAIALAMPSAPLPARAFVPSASSRQGVSPAGAASIDYRKERN